jgi:hypothetical protein
MKNQLSLNLALTRKPECLRHDNGVVVHKCLLDEFQCFYNIMCFVHQTTLVLPMLLENVQSLLSL